MRAKSNNIYCQPLILFVMAKDFSFPFYINNWIGGVMYYTFEQKGAYLELLLLQFNHGKFTETQVKQVLNTSYSSVWEIIREKFVTDGTFFWNEKMEEVKENRKAFTESRRNNRLGKTKELTSEKLVKNTSKSLVKLVESESESINTIINYLNNKSEKKFKSETAVTRKLISARLKDYVIDDFFRVIDVKVKQWKGGQMDKYLSPDTLFAEKNFEKYLNETPSFSDEKKKYVLRNHMGSHEFMLTEVELNEKLKGGHWKI